MRRTTTISAFIAVLIVASYALGQKAAAWKVFTSRAGWSISYPADWRIASCQSCKDPKAPDVSVDFFPPLMRTSEGWVMVSPLAGKPQNTTVKTWLADVSKGANLNPHLHEQELTLNGLPALNVRYRGPEGEMEEVYVVSGSKTFSIESSADPGAPGMPLENLRNYGTYTKMLDSFRVIQQDVKKATAPMTSGDQSYTCNYAQVRNRKMGTDVSVRSGPGLQFSKVDQITAGKSVYICDERGDWLKVFYGGVGTPCGSVFSGGLDVRKATACKSGWVNRKWIDVLSG